MKAKGIFDIISAEQNNKDYGTGITDAEMNEYQLIKDGRVLETESRIYRHSSEYSIVCEHKVGNDGVVWKTCVTFDSYKQASGFWTKLLYAKDKEAYFDATLENMYPDCDHSKPEQHPINADEDKGWTSFDMERDADGNVVGVSIEEREPMVRDAEIADSIDSEELLDDSDEHGIEHIRGCKTPQRSIYDVKNKKKIECPKAKDVLRFTPKGGSSTYTFFIHRPLIESGFDKKGWNISEASTGCAAVYRATTQNEAIETLCGTLNKMTAEQFEKNHQRAMKATG